MAKTAKTRQHPRLKPCALGQQLAQVIGDGATRVARRKALAARLGVSDGYLHFLCVGEVNNDGSLITPSDNLAARLRELLSELGGLKKAASAQLTMPATPAATTAPKAEEAPKPAAKASKRTKPVKKAKAGATRKPRKASRKGGRK